MKNETFESNKHNKEFIRMYQILSEEEDIVDIVFTDEKNNILPNKDCFIKYSNSQLLERMKKNDNYNENGKEIFKKKEKVMYAKKGVNYMLEQIPPEKIIIDCKQINQEQYDNLIQLQEQNNGLFPKKELEKILNDNS